MKKFIISLLIVAAFVAIPVSVFAQDTDFSKSATAAGKAYIVSALSFTHDGSNTDLDFGVIIPDASSDGSVSLSASATPTYNPTTVTTLGSSYSAASFSLNGTPGATYTVSLPADGFVVGSDGSDNLEINTWSSSASGTIPVGGSETFYVGGVLDVPAGFTPGQYTANFKVTVAYN